MARLTTLMGNELKGFATLITTSMEIAKPCNTFWYWIYE